MADEHGSFSGSTVLADLACTFRRTSGDAPPPLVGSSITRLGDKLYVFGGRISNARAMVSTLYALDLRSLVWERQYPPPLPPADADAADSAYPSPVTPTSPSRAPSARYFHSAEAWGTKLVFFGGQGPLLEPEEVSSEVEGEGSYVLATLDDIFLYDTARRRWEYPEVRCREGVDPPEARFAHLSALATTTPVHQLGLARQRRLSHSTLTIIGGQNDRGEYVRDACVLDLASMCWVQNVVYGKRAGSYRSLAVTPSLSVREGRRVELGELLGVDELEVHWTELPFSAELTSEDLKPVLVFSNANFDDPRRDLDLFLTLPTDPALVHVDLTRRMTGELPPGLRFPTGCIFGRHLVVAGLHKGADSGESEFVFWALDLGPSGVQRDAERLTWKRLETGSMFRSASWNRAVGWRNSIVVLGSRDRDVVEDYNSRRASFDHAAFVDLEAHGIYDPPPRQLAPEIQALSLLTLSQPALSDFEIVCGDGARLGCSRTILEDRWPWFRREVRGFEAKTQLIQSAQDRREKAQPPSPTLEYPETSITSLLTPASPVFPHPSFKRRRIISVTPRCLTVPVSAPAIVALLEFFYTLSVGTPLQLRTDILCQLLVFVRAADSLPNLRALIVHALHVQLDEDQGLAFQIFEAATFGYCTALQARALRILGSMPQVDVASSVVTPEVSAAKAPPLVSRPSYQSTTFSDESSTNHTPPLTTSPSIFSTSSASPHSLASTATPPAMAAAWAEQEESDRRQRDDRARFAAEAIEAENLSKWGESAKSAFFDPLLRRPSISTTDSDSTTTAASLKKTPSQTKASRVVSGVNKLKKFMMVAPTIPVVHDGEKPPLPDRPIDVLTPLHTPAKLVKSRESPQGSRSSVRISKLNISAPFNSTTISAPFNYTTELAPPIKSFPFPLETRDVDSHLSAGLDARARASSIPIDALHSTNHLVRPALHHSPSTPVLGRFTSNRDSRAPVVPPRTRASSSVGGDGGSPLSAVSENTIEFRANVGAAQAFLGAEEQLS